MRKLEALIKKGFNKVAQLVSCQLCPYPRKRRSKPRVDRLAFLDSGQVASLSDDDRGEWFSVPRTVLLVTLFFVLAGVYAQLIYSYDATGNRSQMQILAVTGQSPSPSPTATPTPSPLPPQLILEEFATVSGQAAAVDAQLLVRDPFPVVSPNNLLGSSSDKNTRVALFVSNLDFTEEEAASSVVVNIVDAVNANFDVPAEQVTALIATQVVQVVFRIPTNITPGTCTVRITAHGQTSNSGTIRIRP